MPSPIDWLSLFPPHDRAAWREKVTKELKGRDPDELRVRQEDGFELDPLQTAADADALEHVRTGADAILRAPAPGFAVRERIVGPSPDDAAAQVARAYEDGVDQIELFFDPVRVRRAEPYEPEGGDDERGDVESAAAFGDLPPDVFDDDGTLPEPRGLIALDLGHVATALEPLGLGLDGDGRRPTLALRAGAATTSVVSALVALADRDGGGGTEGRARLRGLEAGYDPVAMAARGELEGTPLEAHWGEAADLVAFLLHHVPEGRALAVDGGPFHVAGATPAQELAAMLCSALETLRRMSSGPADAQRHDPSTTARQLVFRTELSTAPLVEAAKVRALRILWARILSELGLDPRGDRSLDARIVGTTSTRTRARTIDLRTNLVRTAVQGFGGVVGGCDAVCVLPEVLHPDAVHPADLAAARGQLHLMREESHLGAVRDPLGGSYAVEALTDAVGRAAWDLVRAVERDGGLGSEAGRRRLAEEIRRAARVRSERLRRRDAVLVGLSRYADPERESVRVHADKVRATEEALSRETPDPELELEAFTRCAALESAHADIGGTVEAGVFAAVAGARFADMMAARRRNPLMVAPDGSHCTSAAPWPLQPTPGGDGLAFEKPRLIARLLARADGDEVARVRVALLQMPGADAGAKERALARARAGFAEDLWRVAGAEVVPSPPGLDGVDAAVRHVRESGASLACLCAADAVLEEATPALSEALTGLPTPVDLYLAAPPIPALDRFVARFLHRGMDAVDFLEEAWVEQLARFAGGADPSSTAS